MKTITEKAARRTFGKKRFDEDMLNDEDPELKETDWRTSVDDVLKAVDAQLEPHGLEVVQVDTGNDSYVWFLQQRKP